MLIKIVIIGIILVIGGLVFSSEINALFPSTVNSVTDSLNNDVKNLGTKTVNAVEQRIVSSSEQINQKISNSIDTTIDSTTDSINETIINNPFDNIGSQLKNQIFPESTNDQFNPSIIQDTL